MARKTRKTARKSTKKTVSKRTSKKKHSKGHIPLEVLTGRLRKLTRLVAHRARRAY